VGREYQLPFVWYFVGLHHRQEYIHRPTGMPVYQWIQCVQGTGKLEIEGKQFIVNEGQGMLLFPDQAHTYYEITEGWHVHFIGFSGYGVKAFFENFGITQCGVYHLHEPRKIAVLMEQLYERYYVKKQSDFFTYSKILYEIMLEIAKLSAIYEEDNNGHSRNNKVHLVMKYINEHYREVLLLPNLAEYVGLSKQYLCKLFKRVNGFTIFDYIAEVRIAHAKMHLLNNPYEKIKQISWECGYEDVSYFGTVFKKIVGMSPAQFRGRIINNSKFEME